MRAVIAISIAVAALAAVPRASAEMPPVTVFRCARHDPGARKCICPERSYPDRRGSEAICTELRAPELLAPGDGAAGVELEVKLDVRPPQGASAIRFKICRDPACGSPRYHTEPVAGDRASRRLVLSEGQSLHWSAQAVRESRGEPTVESTWTRSRRLTAVRRIVRVTIARTPVRARAELEPPVAAPRPLDSLPPVPEGPPAPLEAPEPPRREVSRERFLGVLLGSSIALDEHVSRELPRVEGILGTRPRRIGTLALGIEASGWYEARRRTPIVHQYPGDPDRMGPQVDQTLAGVALSLVARVERRDVALFAGIGPSYRRFSDADRSVAQLGATAFTGLAVYLQRSSRPRWSVAVRGRVEVFRDVSVGDLRFTLAGAPEIEYRTLENHLAVISIGPEVVF